MIDVQPHIPDPIESLEDIAPIIEKCSKDIDTFLAYWKIAKDDSQQHNWRAIWILDHALQKDKQYLDFIINDLYDFLIETDNHSILRIGLKIIIQRPLLSEDKTAELLNKCEDLALNTKIPVGVRVNALQFIYEFCKTEPDFYNELNYLLNHISENENSAAMTSRIQLIRKTM